MNEKIKDLISKMFGQPLRQDALRTMNFPEKNNQVQAHDSGGRRLSRYIGRLILAGVGHDDIKKIVHAIKENQLWRY